MKTQDNYSKHGQDFINDEELSALLVPTAPDPRQFDEILAKSLAKQPLTPAETAILIRASDKESIDRIFATAHDLKRSVYGNRIVLFAPLYVGNHCINDCRYCGFKRSNTSMTRKTLSNEELTEEVRSLLKMGHKRLILVFGEHEKYNAQFISDSVGAVYKVHENNDSIRRVNINAAPFDHAGFKLIKDSGIGTFQVFQETYHHETYRAMHPPRTRKGDYLWRLDSLSRAFESGCDDMGIGALFGLYDWRFEVLALVRHAEHLMQTYNVGPHTISFPRVKAASGVDIPSKWLVNDDEFKRLVAILRLSTPYTGLILTAREPGKLRDELLELGVSQIDGGTQLDLGGYNKAEHNDKAEDPAEQFQLGDHRTLDEIIAELIAAGHIPSFCTSCYRMGRTGERFMEFAIPGFIEKFCSPNAMLTLMEYLLDHASEQTKSAGFALIEHELAKWPEGTLRDKICKNLDEMQNANKRDIRY